MSGIGLGYLPGVGLFDIEGNSSLELRNFLDAIISDTPTNKHHAEGQNPVNAGA